MLHAPFVLTYLVSEVCDIAPPRHSITKGGPAARDQIERQNGPLGHTLLPWLNRNCPGKRFYAVCQANVNEVG